MEARAILSVLLCYCHFIFAVPIGVVGLVFREKYASYCILLPSGELDQQLSIWVLVWSIYTIALPFIVVCCFFSRLTLIKTCFLYSYYCAFALLQLGWSIYGAILWNGPSGRACNNPDAKPLYSFALVAIILCFTIGLYGRYVNCAFTFVMKRNADEEVAQASEGIISPEPIINEKVNQRESIKQQFRKHFNINTPSYQKVESKSERKSFKSVEELD